MSVQQLLGSICALLLAGILYAGLHPFHVPANQVFWMPNANALRFGEYGTILSSQEFAPPAHGERSIEIWIRPGLIEDSNTMLAFYSPGSSRQVSLMQSLSDLEICIQTSAAWRRTKVDRFYVANAFQDGRTAFWTVTFGTSGTKVYRDGALIRSARLAASSEELSGRLIVANSPIFSEPWPGVMRGLAIFDKALTPDELRRHYISWTTSGTPTLTSDDNSVALYLFNEHAGRVVHNRARPEADLYIPPKFMVLRQTVLDPVWRAFNWQRGFWEDALINVGGFIPFGFFFCACFSRRGMRSPVLLASALGAATSLLIELTQTLLPTRDSSLSDLINNTAGAVLGAITYRGQLASAVDQMMSYIAGRTKSQV